MCLWHIQYEKNLLVAIIFSKAFKMCINKKKCKRISEAVTLGNSHPISAYHSNICHLSEASKTGLDWSSYVTE